jgi:hypothetical protein
MTYQSAGALCHHPVNYEISCLLLEGIHSCLLGVLVNDLDQCGPLSSQETGMSLFW